MSQTDSLELNPKVKLSLSQVRGLVSKDGFRVGEVIAKVQPLSLQS